MINVTTDRINSVGNMLVRDLNIGEVVKLANTYAIRAYNGLICLDNPGQTWSVDTCLYMIRLGIPRSIKIEF